MADSERALRVLIACETSGKVREAFRRRGHDATSCDLLPSDDGSNHHIICDVRELLQPGRWDLMVVAHPPCTRLCNSGVRWLSEPPGKLNETYTKAVRDRYAAMSREERLAFMWAELDAGAELFSDCWNAPVPRIAVENPVMHKHAKQRIRNFEPAAQTVQPWWFGEPFFKATGLYLRGVPPLIPTNKLIPPKRGSEEHKEWSKIHRASSSGANGVPRWKIRSETFQGVADAMAMQWGDFAMQELAA
ncbi:hypothetical protein J7443_17515 [Tropicibacter sp. R15_0]|nr:hypothetical protein [Tropicibacter sp. R15_0]